VTDPTIRIIANDADMPDDGGRYIRQEDAEYAITRQVEHPNTFAKAADYDRILGVLKNAATLIEVLIVAHRAAPMEPGDDATRSRFLAGIDESVGLVHLNISRSL
jgi:hypothetical protein